MLTLKERPKISVFIATSIDGYIAKKNGDIDWLVNYPPPKEDKDCGYRKFYADIDALIMGKNTYEVVSEFATWPYQGKRVIVLSKTLTTVRGEAALYKGEISPLIKKLHADGIKHIYVDGGATISTFLNEGFVDQLIITFIPVVLGSGISLFSNIKNDKWCQLISSHAYSNGLVQLRYEVLR